MKQQEIQALLEKTFGADAVKATQFQDQISVTVPSEKILQIGTFLRDEPSLKFDFLSFVGGVDRMPQKPRFEMVYQLYSTKYKHRFRVKATLDETDGTPTAIDSVTSVWPTANWHERETAEMFGIVFKNHPDPRKLLLPDNWTVHPLRKDFPIEGTDADTPDLPGPARG